MIRSDQAIGDFYGAQFAAARQSVSGQQLEFVVFDFIAYFFAAIENIIDRNPFVLERAT